MSATKTNFGPILESLRKYEDFRNFVYVDPKVRNTYKNKRQLQERFELKQRQLSILKGEMIDGVPGADLKFKKEWDKYVKNYKPTVGIGSEAGGSFDTFKELFGEDEALKIFLGMREISEADAKKATTKFVESVIEPEAKQFWGKDWETLPEQAKNFSMELIYNIKAPKSSKGKIGQYFELGRLKKEVQSVGAKNANWDFYGRMFRDRQNKLRNAIKDDRFHTSYAGRLMSSDSGSKKTLPNIDSLPPSVRSAGKKVKEEIMSLDALRGGIESMEQPQLQKGIEQPQSPMGGPPPTPLADVTPVDNQQRLSALNSLQERRDLFMPPEARQSKMLVGGGPNFSPRVFDNMLTGVTGGADQVAQDQILQDTGPINQEVQQGIKEFEQLPGPIGAGRVRDINMGRSIEEEKMEALQDVSETYGQVKRDEDPYDLGDYETPEEGQAQNILQNPTQPTPEAKLRYGDAMSLDAQKQKELEDRKRVLQYMSNLKGQ